ncbi:hypothetical protein NOLU111490_01445 [Novosphingobium lubricantis]|jgi:hypothetical protein
MERPFLHVAGFAALGGSAENALSGVQSTVSV